MKTIVKIFVLIAFVCVFSKLNSQERQIFSNFGYGFTSPHHKDMWNYITGHTKQINLAYLEKRSDLNSHGKNILKGINICFINTGNPDTMGYSLGASPEFHIPIIPDKSLYFLLGCGIEYNTKTYDKDDNYSFSAIGSHFNALIRLGFYNDFKISNRFKLNTGFFINHFSNGIIKSPNLGLNVLTLNAGLKYQLSEKKHFQKKIRENIKSGSWQFVGTGSIKQIRHDQQKSAAFLLSAEKFIKTKHISSFGFGTDFILDYSMKNRLYEVNKHNYSFSDNIKIALKSSWTIPVSELQIHLQAGSYLKNSNFKKEFVFERLGLRYFVNKNIALNIALRAHFAKADAIEFGVAYRIE